ncbi:MAG: kelch repeat-containing protein [Chloroflexota bacterium]
MKRMLVVLILLTLLVAVALPALAAEKTPTTLAVGWNLLSPTTSPPPRASQAMAYDTARGVAVLFGGADDTFSYDDTWQWSSSTLEWTQATPAHHPSARWGHAMAYDEARGVVVLFGGISGTHLNDTWIFDGTDWSELTPADAPSPRILSAMAYDPQQQVVVLYGGEFSILEYGDTWTFDGLTWQAQPVAGPPARAGSGMVYDSRRQVMTLFGGGISEDPFAYRDTWEWTGSGDWVEVTPAQSPSKRERMGMVYSPRFKRTFLYGGLDGGFGYYNDTAIWNGQRWQSGTFDPSPSARCCLAMVYDPVVRGVLLFGGSATGAEMNDVWYFR